jgi:aconitate hydratase
MQRNKERYEFLRWGQKSFANFQVVPPGTGICHQVNLEYLGKTVWSSNIDGIDYAYPDTLVGTDSHTTMINGLGILGWGVGGIEAEAAMLGQPVSMLIPEVIGFKMTGKLREGITATDLVLTVTQMLRQKGVVGKFVEFYGPGLADLPLADRATISNMAPEYGATCGFFPVDKETLRYLRLTGRDEHNINLVEAYCKEQGLWYEKDAQDPVFTDSLSLDLDTIEPSLAGPKRPQDKVNLKTLPVEFNAFLKKSGKEEEKETEFEVHGEDYNIHHGDVVIAAITSCTNTSNPSVMIGAGLVAKKARERGIDVKPWVKTSLAPGSKVVTDYLKASNLLPDLEALRFHVVGYGCTSCIGNSGPLPPHIDKAVTEHDLIVASALSGNRNFEARVHPKVKMNFLMSPMLVVAFALAGRVDIDMDEEPLGYDSNDQPVFLKDIWPTTKEIQDVMARVLTAKDYEKNYGEIFDGNEQWQELTAPDTQSYKWEDSSTYIKEAPFFQNLPEEPEPAEDVKGAYPLLVLGHSITTDHISPAGSFAEDSAAGKYLRERGVEKKDFNSYGSRRGNDEVMTRGTFANVRINNQLVEKEGGFTKHIPSGEEMTVYDAAMKYKEENTPLVVLAGKEYGSGSSRDWAAKGTDLLGIKAVIAESYERIHRSNLVGMGVMPLQYSEGETAESLGLSGEEKFDIAGIADGLKPGKKLKVTAHKKDGGTIDFEVLARLDSDIEVEYYKNGGILQYVFRGFLKK